MPIDTTTADRRYWNKLAKALGWRLYGWTYRNHASFITSPPGIHYQFIEVTGSQRDAILAAIEKGKQK